MGKNELSEAGTSMVRDNMANFRRDTRKTRVTGYPSDKAWNIQGVPKNALGLKCSYVRLDAINKIELNNSQTLIL